MGEYFEKIVNDIKQYFPSRVVPSIFNFVAIAIYTRLLSPEDYGIYIIIFSTITFISTIFLSWLNYSNLRFLKKYSIRSKVNALIATNSILFFILSISIFFINLGILLILNTNGVINSSKFFTYLTANFAFVFLSCFTYTQNLLRANRESEKYKYASIIKSAGVILFAVILIKLLGLRSEAIFISIATTCSVLSVYLFKDFLDNWDISIANLSHNVVRSSLSYGLPMTGAAIGGLMLSLSDRYIIQYMLDNKAVGIYSAGYSISEKSILLFSQIIMLAAFPVIIESYEKDKKLKTQQLITRLTSLYFLILVPIVVGLICTSREIVEVFLGEKFSESYLLLPIIGFGVFFQGLTQYVNKSYELLEKTESIFFLTTLSGVLNIISNFLLIPRYGIIGGAFSTLISYLFYLTLSYISTKDSFKWIIPWRTILKSIFSSIIMLIMLTKININYGVLTDFIIKVTLGVIVYFLGLLILQESNLIDFITNLDKFRK